MYTLVKANRVILSVIFTCSMSTDYFLTISACYKMITTKLLSPVTVARMLQPRFRDRKVLNNRHFFVFYTNTLLYYKSIKSIFGSFVVTMAVKKTKSSIGGNGQHSFSLRSDLIFFCRSYAAIPAPSSNSLLGNTRLAFYVNGIESALPTTM